MTTDSSLTARGIWVPVMIAKRDEDGNAICDDEGQITEVARLLNTETGDFYVDDTIEEVREKCMCIPLGLPIYTVGQMAWSASRFFLDIPVAALRALKDFVDDWKKGRTAGELCGDLVKKITLGIPGRMITNVRHFISAPVFACGVLAASLYGIVSPYEGREWEAKVEHLWEEKVSFKEDVRWQKIEDAHACYLAHCFQSRGNIRDGKYFVNHVEWRNQPPKEKIDFSDLINKIFTV